MLDWSFMDRLQLYSNCMKNCVLMFRKNAWPVSNRRGLVRYPVIVLVAYSFM